MKITRVETITVVVPLHEGAWHSAEFVPEGYTYGGQWIRLHWPEFPIVLLKLHTDEGLVGLGEVPKGVPEADGPPGGAVFRRAGALVVQSAGAPAGNDVVSRPVRLLRLRDGAVRSDGQGAERPCLAPASAGKYRDLGPGLPLLRPNDAGRMRRRRPSECVAQGYSVLKMKATADDPLVDRLEAIQDAVGRQACTIVVDPNQRFYRPVKLFALDRPS